MSIFVLYNFRLKDESSSSDEDHKSSSQISGVFQSEPLESSGGICYKKTLRLTSEQLVQCLFLHLLLLTSTGIQITLFKIFCSCGSLHIEESVQ